MSGTAGPARLTVKQLEKIWGTTRLSPWFPDSQQKIGEIWFLSETGGPLPLLLKFIFTSERLSIQVHPNDEYACEHEDSQGKTEMWYVLRADPGASIGVGLREKISKERLREASLSGEIEQLMVWHPVAPGDTFFIPAGTIHALGVGVAVCEIQQQSDVTYRLYDYGRPRELHLERGVDVSDPGPHPGKAEPRRISDSITRLAECRYFVTELVQLAGPLEYEIPAGQSHMLILLDGEGRFDGDVFRAGDGCAVSEGTPPFLIEPSGPSGPLRFIRAWIP